MELTDFIKRNIVQIENNINNALDYSYLQHLVKKETYYGYIHKLILHSSSGKKKLINFSLSYTFFEDKEDEFGQRPNDVTLSILLQVDDQLRCKINQEIVFGSEIEDIEFNELNIESLSNVNFEKIFSFSEIEAKLKTSIERMVSLFKAKKQLNF